MKNFANYIVSCVIFLSGCDTIQLVKVPECTLLSSSIICAVPSGWGMPDSCIENPDYDGDGDEYECPLSVTSGWQCTTPTGYHRLHTDIEEKLKELELCRINSKSDSRKDHAQDSSKYTRLPYSVGR